MKNKSKLRELKDKKLYINDDMLKENREAQKKIRRIAQQERSKWKTVKKMMTALGVITM